MKITSLLFTAFFLCQIPAMSQEADDENISILKSVRTFRFVKGTAENPVVVKEEHSRTFTCNKYRTDVPVVELFNSIETMDDVDIRVDGSKRHGIVPRYEYYNRDGIFYSDEQVCYFALPVSKIGSKSEVTIKKTIKDPRYFTNIFFTEGHAINEQEIKLYVPAWVSLDIKEYHFGKYNIRKSVSQESGETVYTFSMNDIPKFKQESSAPGLTYYAPHILVLCKSAQPKDVSYTYFKTVKEQYEWYQSLVQAIGDDEKVIKEKAEEIVKGISNEEEKVKKIFQWVQDNIRYIAFENGIAGFKPEKAQEVLRKKYGDCKGMANLLTVMLRSIKLDARRCWIGTKHIAYDYSTPSLSVDNHMICAWMKNGKPVYLDATEKYIGFGETAERIQGRQTLIENGNQYLLEKVPVASYLQNTSTENRKLVIEGNNLKGHVTHVWKGENKEWLLNALADIKQDKQENALKQFLAEGESGFEISNLKITNLTDYNNDLKIEYDVLWKNAVTVFDKDAYLSIDNRTHFKDYKIDADKRKLPYWIQFKNNLVFEMELILPADKTITELPGKIAIKQPGYSFNAAYTNETGKLRYRTEIIIQNAEILPENFSQWNKDIKQLTDFYDQQVVLTSKK
ncbi:transglutaminase-like domain-containing protein [Lacibacter sediminis]|uniref:Transglutaminase domain-containing protein n=1 Tax=Lacibacter sediminis TaxID=2760713 RepID=A0A7G5XCQ1_9BACT|nr:transglutaminase domain-containing protein [Lacibacter sediminis]QNA43254.1 transglutaminase domain-containing protein [Lacibacter sediminis]